MEEQQPKQSFFKRRKKELILTVIALLIVIGVAFAWLTQTVTSTSTNVVVSGKLRLTILNEDPIVKAGGEDGYAIPMDDEHGLATTPYTFTVQNTGDVAANYEITLINSSSYNERVTVTDEYGNPVTDYYGYPSYQNVERQVYYESQRIEDSKIKYNIREGSNTNTTTSYLNSSFGRVLISGTLSPGATKTYELRLWVAQEAVNADIVGKVFAANLSINSIQYQDSLAKNPYINAVYKYIEEGEGTGAAFTGCLGGAEAGCTDISSQMTKLTKYPTGTVIKYEVKSGTEVYFNVIHDDGDTLTLQQRENTVNSRSWYGKSSDYTNANGPELSSGRVLYDLEQIAGSWINVKEITYSIGDNTSTLGYSGCSAYNNCSVNKYTLSRTARARMITVQELDSLGCTTTNMSCLRFINNYLGNSTGYGGTFASGNTFYWTMSAASGNSSNVWYIRNDGRLSTNLTYVTSNGARAVVVIDK